MISSTRLAMCWIQAALMIQAVTPRFHAEKEEVKDDQKTQHVIKSTWIGRFVVRIVSVCYTAAVLSSSSSLPQIDALDIAGFIICTSGSLLRLVCMRELDRFFTFELAIRKDHKLIKTGPYRFLVHPAYSGWFISYAGFVMFIFRKHILARLLFFLPLPGYTLDYVIFVAYMIIPGMIYFAYQRVVKEEAELKKRFEKEWDEYFRARKRFIPFVF